jgi:hypothetical protein
LLSCTYKAGADLGSGCLNSYGFSRFASYKVAHLGRTAMLWLSIKLKKNYAGSESRSPHEVKKK